MVISLNSLISLIFLIIQMQHTLPQAFIQNIEAQIDDATLLFEALDGSAPVSMRVNPSKVFDATIGEAIPWTSTGIYLPERPIFTLDPAYHAGAYYVQEASSMLIARALDSLPNLKNRPIRILDLCAAPGGKSTLLAQTFSENSLLVANEIIKTRVPILKENLLRWGYPNVVVTSVDPEQFAKISHFFDVILVDAPCSGEGMFRKIPASRNEWSASNVAMCAARQKKIIAAVQTALKPGGILLYSTCTYNPQENIENVDWMSQEFDLQSVKIDDLQEFGVAEISKNNVLGYQCFPHKVRGEGFFMSVLMKNGIEINEKRRIESLKYVQKLDKKEAELLNTHIKNDAYEYFKNPINEVVAIAKNNVEAIAILEKAIKVNYISIVGELKGKDFVPGHFLALSTFFEHPFSSIELDKQTALHFLKKENILVNAPQGWYRMTFGGNGLGFAKVLPNRINNYLPKEWRIRMDVE